MTKINIEEDQKYSFYLTSGGSMFPFVRWGEHIIVKKTDPNIIEIGDIILFLDKNNLKVAHRVINKKTINNKLIFQTKGDHNHDVDDEIIEDQIIGKVVILKRENRLFLFPSKGPETIIYKLSCWYFSVKKFIKKVAAKFLRLVFPKFFAYIKRGLNGN